MFNLFLPDVFTFIIFIKSKLTLKYIKNILTHFYQSKKEWKKNKLRESEWKKEAGDAQESLGTFKWIKTNPSVRPCQEPVK